MTDAKLIRLMAPNGATVRVSEERAKTLLESGGYKSADKAPAKKAASGKKSE